MTRPKRWDQAIVRFVCFAPPLSLRYRREMEREGQSVPEIVPLTFLLPQEYTLFADYAARAGPNACWIAKPVGKSQGQGIFLFTKMSKIKHLQMTAGERRGGGVHQYRHKSFWSAPVQVATAIVWSACVRSYLRCRVN